MTKSKAISVQRITALHDLDLFHNRERFQTFLLNALSNFENLNGFVLYFNEKYISFTL